MNMYVDIKIEFCGINIKHTNTDFCMTLESRELSPAKTNV